ncbi:MAG: hypothetical protein WC816_00880 [Sphingomonas sp.]|jgi:filamentous hemagglutinin family protein
MIDQHRWRVGRASLLETTSIAAILLGVLALPTAAYPQAFQGAHSVASGDVFVTTGAGTTDIFVNTSSAVLNWTPTDTSGSGTVNFLPSGTTASFHDGPGLNGGNYTILNRVIPVNASGLPTNLPIAFNGTVNSYVGSAFGGNVWFYSPGGIIVGATGAFNVGGLVLTSNDIDTTGGLFGPNGEIRFGVTPPVAGSSVQIMSGAQFNASNYLAVVSPRIVQGGTATVNGSTAYVAAEKASIKINGGLFDIQIDTGTSDANGIVHTGTTTGPATTGATDYQRIYMVALAKNTALTMLLSGTIGYAPAASAANEAGSVVLSAGGNVASGDIVPVAGTPATTENASIANARFLLPTTGYATGGIDISAGFQQLVEFDADTSLTAAKTIDVTANSGLVHALGNLSLVSGNGAVGGAITVTASNAISAVTVDKLLTIDASGFAPIPQSPPAFGADATGGTVNVSANGGAISTGGLAISATGTGGTATDTAGSGTGGSITLSSLNGGSISAPGTLTLDVTGSALIDSVPLHGGAGTGGSINLTGDGGTLAFQDLVLSARGVGGYGTVTNGDAVGGSIDIALANIDQNWTSLTARGDASADAIFYNGLEGNATGSANGVTLDIGSNATLNVSNAVTLSAESYSQATSASGNTTTGGTVGLSVHGGGALVTPSLSLTTLSRAFVPPNVNQPTAGSAPLARGGTINVDLNGGSVNADQLSVAAVGGVTGGLDQIGTAMGGDISVAVRNGGVLTVNDGGGTIDASGRGCCSAPGVNAVGGTVLVYASDGTINANGSLTLSANGAGSPSLTPGLPGGFGTGGTVTLETRAGTSNSALISASQLTVQALGDGDELFEAPDLVYSYGDGGVATGGTVAINLLGGNFNVGQVDLSANAVGGNSLGYTAGAGIGGNAGFLLNGGDASVGFLSISADGLGGTVGFGPSSGSPGVGGAGVGGNATFTAVQGGLSGTSLLVSANGTGGRALESYDGDGQPGGAGTGGVASLLMPASSSAFVGVEGIGVRANGVGGVGGDVRDDPTTSFTPALAGAGGAGQGGQAITLVEGGGLSTGQFLINADGLGGAGGSSAIDGVIGAAGGSGQGGSTRFSAIGTASLGIYSLGASANGTGGAGGQARIVVDTDPNGNPIYDYSSSAGGIGGDAAGGDSTATFGVDADFNDLSVVSTALGGAGGNGGSGGNGGFNANGGLATLAVTGGQFSVSNAFSVSAAATGGIGGDGKSNRGGDGGGAQGGTALLSGTGPTTHIDVQDLVVDADATAGNGGLSATDGTPGVPGASGGFAFGGNATLNLDTGARMSFADALVGVTATGGNFSDGTPGATPQSPPGGSGAAGGALGGSASATLNGATLDYFSRFDGSGEFNVHSDTVAGNGFGATAGATAFTATNANVQLNGLFVTTSGQIDGDAAFTNTNSAISIGGNLEVSSQGYPFTPGHGVRVGTEGTTVNINGYALFRGGNVALTFTGAGKLDIAGDWQVNADNQISADHLSQSTTNPFESAHAAAIYWSAGGDIVDSGQTLLRSDGVINFYAGGNATLGTLFAGGDIVANVNGNLNAMDATTTGGAIDWTSFAGSITARQLDSDGEVSLVAPTGVTIADLLSGTDATLTATNGAVLVSHDLVASGQIVATGASVTLNAVGSLGVADAQATAGALTINAGDALTLTNGSASGDAVLTSPGAMIVNTLTAGGALSLTSGTTLGLQSATVGGNAQLTATGDVTVGGLASGGAVTIGSGGVAGFTGGTTGTTISVQSRDIAIGTNATLGQPGMTNAITLASTNTTGPAIIGGAAPTNNASGYNLSQAEFSGLFATNITINAPRVSGATAGLGGAPDLILRDLSVNAGTSGNLSTTGLLTITTPGSARVEGALGLRGIDLGGGINLNAGDTLSVLAGSGSIELLGANGDLSGHLDLSAATIIAATPGAITDVAGMTSVAQRSTRLGQNDGVLLDDGVLRASALTLNGSSGIFIQNTGATTAFDDRRGFTAGTISLATRILGAQSSSQVSAANQPQIVINGRLLPTAAGPGARGLGLIPLLSINGATGGAAGQFDPLSTANGCVIVNSGACSRTSIDTGPPLTGDQLDGKLTPPLPVAPFATVGPVASRLLTFQTTIRNGYPPLIDEPITGVGNEDLWNAGCGANNGSCAAGGNGQP